MAFIFVLSTLGMNVAVGYCPMKKEYRFSLDGKAPSCCCEKAGAKGCCRSHKVVLKKIEDRYTSSQVQLDLPSVDLISGDFPSFIIRNTCTASVSDAVRDHHPPEPPVPLSILYRSIQV